MARPNASLASLLIISAIDLLLCCFTMGVMLFLVLQPSQRSDTGKAKIVQASTSPGTAAPTASGGKVPVVIIIDNLGENHLKPNAGSSAAYTLVSPSNADGSGSLIYTAAGPDGVPPLVVSSTDKGRKVTKALISVAVSGRLVQGRIDCRGDGTVTINLDRQSPIGWACLDPQSSDLLCAAPPFGTHGEVELKQFQPGQMRLLNFTQIDTQTIFSPGTSVCLLSPVFPGALEFFGYEQRRKWFEMLHRIPMIRPPGRSFLPDELVPVISDMLTDAGVTVLAPLCHASFRSPRAAEDTWLISLDPTETRPSECVEIDLSDHRDSN